MSIFPTKILLATDGSTEAELAARTAVDLSQKPTPNCTHTCLGRRQGRSLDGCALLRSNRPLRE